MSTPAAQLKRPTLVVHADWGSHPAKRWMANARFCGDSFQVEPPEPVGELEDFLHRLKTKSGPEGCVLLGFDFPIGLPFTYAQKAGIHNFLKSLPKFGQGEWQDFYHVAYSADQISIQRPFYPFRPGGTTRQHLLDKLELQSIDELRRECEKAPPQERAASPIFWTLGAQQVGKAALNGWEQVIVPGLTNPSLDIVIWPFSGYISELIRPERIIIAETYPAQYLHQLDLLDDQIRFSKLRQSDRAMAAARLIQTAEKYSIMINPELETSMRDGFGPKKDGDDRFDAVLGLFGMLQFFTGLKQLPEPDQPRLRQIEGWILGLPLE